MMILQEVEVMDVYHMSNSIYNFLLFTVHTFMSCKESRLPTGGVVGPLSI